MGFELAKEVASRCGHLTGNTFKVLNKMAWTALDAPSKDHEAKLYFGGWEPLALALGYVVPPPDKDDDDVTKRRKQLHNQVGKALTGAAEAQAFERLVDHPRTGSRQTFRLTLERVCTPVLGVQQDPQNVGTQDPLNVGTGCTPKKRDPAPTKRRSLETTKDSTKTSRQNQHVALADSTTDRECAACGDTRFTVDGFCVGCGAERQAS